MDAHFPPSPPAITREAKLHCDMKRHGYPRDFRRALLSDLRRVDGCSREKVRITVTQFRLDWPQYNFAPFLGFVMLINPYVYASTSYQIARSLRFNSADSAYLSRTFSTTGTDRHKRTVAVWVKRGTLGTAQNIIHGYDGSATARAYLGFDANDKLISQFGGTAQYQLITTQVFRDPTAWVFVLLTIDTTQATAADRVKMEVNGVAVSSYATANYPAQNDNSQLLVNSANNDIGQYASTTYLNAYLAEMHVIDGQALTSSDFGEVDSVTGAWVPKAYAGTYGTNGFYLDFSDNSAATAAALGADRSGNGNNWTPNNLSVSAGVGNDSLVDTPTNYGTDTGAGGEVRGNYATWNPLQAGNGTNGTISNGNLDVLVGSGNTIGLSTVPINAQGGKIFVEAEVTVSSNGGEWGIAQPSGTLGVSQTGVRWSVYYNGTEYYCPGTGWSGVVDAAGTPNQWNIATTDHVLWAIDIPNNKVWLGRRATSGGAVTWAGGGDPSAGTNPTFSDSGGSGVYSTSLDLSSGLPFFIYVAAATGSTHTFKINFGQRPFVTTAPTGFKALCTQNLPNPDVLNPRSAFNINLRTGTGAAANITGLSFQPNLYIGKSRSAATDWAWYDSVRGVQKQLENNTTTDESTETTGLTAFNSDGISIGALAQINTSAESYVDYFFREGPTYGMDIVSYTGNGANRTISHDLGVVPELIIVKARTTAGVDTNWVIYHKYNTAAPETDYLLFTAAATADANTLWNDTAPTSSVFSVGTAAEVNTNSDPYIAYLFASKTGLCKIGGYTGNGSADGPFVYCGFRPRFIMIKRTNSTGNWVILDNKTDTMNPITAYRYADTAGAESPDGASTGIDFLSNGFKLRDSASGWNASGGTYIFMALADTDFKFARAA